MLSARNITRLPTCVHRGVSRLVWSGQTVRCNVSEASLGLDRHLRGFSRSDRIQQVSCHQVLVPRGFLGAARRLGPLVFEGSHASKKALQRFSTDRASGAVSGCPWLHLAGERSTGPTPRQHQLGDADSRVLPIASYLSSQSASVGFPCHRGVTSAVGWVLLPFHTVPPACLINVGSALGERKRLTLVLSRVQALFR